MSEEQAIFFEHFQADTLEQIIPIPEFREVLNSDRAGWRNIHLAQFISPDTPWQTPAFHSQQHMIGIPDFISYPVSLGFKYNSDRRIAKSHWHPRQPVHDCIHICPEGVYSVAWDRATNTSHFLLEPSFVAEVAHETVDGDRVELAFEVQASDLLIYQLFLALNTELETSLKTGNPSDAFYVDALATALAAHILKHYTTRPQTLREYADGLPKEKLDRAIDYMQAYLNKNLSLEDMATELGMSQYYFCHLFKQSMGISPHQYLIQQRVERAKFLLRRSKKSIANIAAECGFANQSHLARYFRRHTGVSPSQFRQK